MFQTLAKTTPLKNTGNKNKKLTEVVTLREMPGGMWGGGGGRDGRKTSQHVPFCALMPSELCEFITY